MSVSGRVSFFLNQGFMYLKLLQHFLPPLVPTVSWFFSIHLMTKSLKRRTWVRSHMSYKVICLKKKSKKSGVYPFQQPQMNQPHTHPHQTNHGFSCHGCPLGQFGHGFAELPWPKNKASHALCLGAKFLRCHVSREILGKFHTREATDNGKTENGLGTVNTVLLKTGNTQKMYGRFSWESFFGGMTHLKVDQVILFFLFGVEFVSNKK